MLKGSLHKVSGPQRPAGNACKDTVHKLKPESQYVVGLQSKLLHTHAHYTTGSDAELKSKAAQHTSTDRRTN